jgi:cytochrome c oxidase subunit 2
VGNDGGRIGPNLTRVGARSSLGAGTVAGNRSGFAAWIALGQELKPQNKMPPFRHLGVDELTRISAYLEQLR